MGYKLNKNIRFGVIKIKFSPNQKLDRIYSQIDENPYL